MKKRELSRYTIKILPLPQMELFHLGPAFISSLVGHVSTIRQGAHPEGKLHMISSSESLFSYVEMLRSAAENFPSTIYDPPPESASNAPILNLNLGGVNVSLGGAAGSGVYRTSSDAVGVQADGLRDGVMNLIGRVKQGVDRIAQ